MTSFYWYDHCTGNGGKTVLPCLYKLLHGNGSNRKTKRSLLNYQPQTKQVLENRNVRSTEFNCGFLGVYININGFYDVFLLICVFCLFGDPSSCYKTHSSAEQNTFSGIKAQMMTEVNDCLCLDMTWCRNLRSSGTLCSVEGRIRTDVSGQPIEPSPRVNQFFLHDPWGWGR